MDKGQLLWKKIEEFRTGKNLSYNGMAKVLGIASSTMFCYKKNQRVGITSYHEIERRFGELIEIDGRVQGPGKECEEGGVTYKLDNNHNVINVTVRKTSIDKVIEYLVEKYDHACKYEAEMWELLQDATTRKEKYINALNALRDLPKS